MTPHAAMYYCMHVARCIIARALRSVRLVRAGLVAPEHDLGAVCLLMDKGST